MVRRKHQDARGRLGHGLKEVGRDPAHHGAVEDEPHALYWGVHGAQDLQEAHAYGDLQGKGLGQGARNREPLFRDGFLKPHVEYGFDVTDDDAHIQRDAPFGDRPSRGVPDQDVLVARGVGVSEGAHIHASRQFVAEAVNQVASAFP